MKTLRIQMKPEDFFHARPSMILCSEAKKHQSVILISLGMEVADAKEVFSLMRLSRPKGRTVEVLIDGPDEAEAASAMEEAFRRAF